MTREELRDYVDEQRSLNNIPYHVYSALIDGIDTLEEEPKTGHWYRISSHDTYYGLTDFKCSKCGEEISKEGDWLYEYCPRCGSPMMIEPDMSEIPTSSKPEISSYYGLKSYVRERNEE